MHSGISTTEPVAAVRNPPCRQGLRQQRHPPSGRRQRHDAEHSAQSQSALEELLLACPLQASQCNRTHVLPPERLPSGCHPLRPKRRQLPRRNLHRGYRQLLVMSPSPRVLTPCALPANAGWRREYPTNPLRQLLARPLSWRPDGRGETLDPRWMIPGVTYAPS